jgi:hypothetical protein
MLWCGLSWCGLSWCGLSWCGLSWCGLSWCGLSGHGLTWPVVGEEVPPRLVHRVRVSLVLLVQLIDEPLVRPEVGTLPERSRPAVASQCLPVLCLLVLAGLVAGVTRLTAGPVLLAGSCVQIFGRAREFGRHSRYRLFPE